MNVPYRILYYNWAPYFEEPVQGGGVSVYCKNLIDYLTNQDKLKITFLYSGFDYNYLRPDCYIRKAKNKMHPKVSTFSIVNSSIPAPSHLSFYDPKGNVSSYEVDKCFQQFLLEQEPFNVIHFQNLEGLTANCLKIAKESGAKVVFSLHNYWALCPQVNLWKLESNPCFDYLEGRACIACLPSKPAVTLNLHFRKLTFLGNLVGLNDQALLLKALRKIFARTYYFWQLLKIYSQSPLKKSQEFVGKDLPQHSQDYHERRTEIISLINTYVDVAVSVSERTASIYSKYGVEPKRLTVNYIGTQAHDFQVPLCNRADYSSEKPFRLIYMGPSRPDKGFYFLLEALRSLSKEELNLLSLTVAGKITDGAELEMSVEHRGKLLSLAQSLHHFHYIAGYTYKDIPNILKEIHLGIVPPLWEDNLPQVTFELLACKVPVLCSNRGGAQEFVRHPAFIFDPSKEGDFQEKLLHIRNKPQLLKEFWEKARPVISLAEHYEDLIKIYT
jgi:glycosyltransferase involved in cell wall biosynthesis